MLMFIPYALLALHLPIQEPKPHFVLRGHSAPIVQVLFSSDGKTLVSYAADNGKPGELKVWDVATGKERLSVKPEVPRIEFAVAPHGQLLVYYRDWLKEDQPASAVVWDVQTGSKLACVNLPGHIRGAYFIKDGKTIVTLGSGSTFGVWETTLWDARIGLKQASFASVPYSRLRETQDGKKLAFLGESSLRLLDALSFEEVSLGQSALSISPWWEFSPDNTFLGHYEIKAGRIDLWDLRTGRQRTSLPASPLKTTYYGVFSADGRTLAIPDDVFQSKVAFWDVVTGNRLAAVCGAVPVFSPDNRMVAIRNNDKEIGLLELASGHLREILRGWPGEGTSGALGFACGGRALYTYHYLWNPRREERLRLWNVTTGREVSTWKTTYPSSSVAPDCSFLAIGCEDGTIKLWNTAKLLAPKVP